MKFDFECDLPDGLVLIDKAYFDEFNDDILYSFEILLDSKGITELVYDFPEEKWEAVRERETALIKDFCNSGKMMVFLSDRDVKDCSIDVVENIYDTDKYLYIPSGKLILVNAGELIQCLAYPELDMEKILEINVESGTYAVENEGIEKISLLKSSPTQSVFNNVIE